MTTREDFQNTAGDGQWAYHAFGGRGYGKGDAGHMNGNGEGDGFGSHFGDSDNGFCGGGENTAPPPGLYLDLDPTPSKD